MSKYVAKFHRAWDSNYRLTGLQFNTQFELADTAVGNSGYTLKSRIERKKKYTEQFLKDTEQIACH